MSLCLIPARLNSVRLPGKNLLPFAGRPLAEWSIRTALEAAIFETVVVTTDQPEILWQEIDPELAQEVLWIRQHEDDKNCADILCRISQLLCDPDDPDSVLCCLYATAPWVTLWDLRAALGALQGKLELLVSAVPGSRIPDGGFQMIRREALRNRRSLTPDPEEPGRDGAVPLINAQRHVDLNTRADYDELLGHEYLYLAARKAWTPQWETGTNTGNLSFGN